MTGEKRGVWTKDFALKAIKHPINSRIFPLNRNVDMNLK
jgi:hypothetical protein